MPKATPTSRGGSSFNKGAKVPRHDPLHVSLNADESLHKFGRLSKPNKSQSRQEDDDEADSQPTKVEGARMSRKILDLAREQRDDIEGQDEDEGLRADEDEGETRAASTSRQVGSGKSRSKKTKQLEDSDDEVDSDEFEGAEEEMEEEYEELEIDPEDYQTLSALASSGHAAIPQSLLKLSAQSLDASNPNAGGEGANGGVREEDHVEDDGEPKTLADVIFAKMQAAEEASGSGSGIKLTTQPERQDGPLDPRVGLNPKVVEVYTKVGVLLSRYKSGPLPRALKILPSLPHWAQLLAITNPPQWTPHATYACTKIFVSNLKPDEVKVFLQGILLDQVRDNMMDHEKAKSGKTGGKLDVQLYEALKKGLYKPSAFFKGILFPLCESGCSLKEATIVASVLSKVSVPVLHSAAALLRLAGMDYTGPNSLFIRVLLDKKYALPYKVVDALVFHYIRLANSNRSKDGDDKLPVLWHQSLLVFVQRYASDLTPDQKDALLDVIRARPHPQISSEIRRELINSVVRGEPRPEENDVDMR